MSKDYCPTWCWAVVDKAFLVWTREVKKLRCSCVSCTVLGLTGTALDPKSAERRAYPPDTPLVLPSRVLCEEAEQISRWILVAVLGGQKANSVYLIQVQEFVLAAAWCIWEVLCKEHHRFFTCTPSPITSLQLASLGPNDTVILNPSKITTSSLISGSCVPPGHLGNLAVVLSWLI